MIGIAVMQPVPGWGPQRRPVYGLAWRRHGDSKRTSATAPCRAPIGLPRQAPRAIWTNVQTSTMTAHLALRIFAKNETTNSAGRQEHR